MLSPPLGRRTEPEALKYIIYGFYREKNMDTTMYGLRFAIVIAVQYHSNIVVPCCKMSW